MPLSCRIFSHNDKPIFKKKELIKIILTCNVILGFHVCYRTFLVIFSFSQASYRNRTRIGGLEILCPFR